MSETSGFVKVENLSGGVFRSSTPNTIPEISQSDISNFDVENSAIKTRAGVERYSDSGHKPPMLKFGLNCVISVSGFFKIYPGSGSFASA